MIKEEIKYWFNKIILRVEDKETKKFIEKHKNWFEELGGKDHEKENTFRKRLERFKRKNNF